MEDTALKEKKVSQQTQWTEKAIMVTGMAQGGTTLLQNMLDGHPEMLMYPDEPSFLLMSKRRHCYENANHLVNDWIYGTPNSFHLSKEASQLPQYPKGFESKRYKPLPSDFSVTDADRRELVQDKSIFGMDPEHQQQAINLQSYFQYIQDAAQSQRIKSERDLIIEAMKGLKQACRYQDREVKCWAFKQPSLYPYSPHYLENFFSSFLEGKAVVILRDPRSVVNSNQKLERRKGNISKNALKRYYYFTRNVLRMEESCWSITHQLRPLFKDKIHFVYYEELVSDTEKVMRGVADFLGLPFNEVLLKPTNFGFPVEVRTAEGETKSAVYKTALNKWEKGLTYHQIAMIEAVAEDYIASMHLKFKTPKPIRWLMKIYMFLLEFVFSAATAIRKKYPHQWSIAKRIGKYNENGK